jgi:hypothetical protein
MAESLTLGGWLFMVGAWTAIVALNVWCFRRIFQERPNDIVDPVTTDKPD